MAGTTAVIKKTAGKIDKLYAVLHYQRFLDPCEIPEFCGCVAEAEHPQLMTAFFIVVEYSLTDLGRALTPALDTLGKWGHQVWLANGSPGEG